MATHGNEVAVKITDLCGPRRSQGGECGKIDQRVKWSVENEVYILTLVSGVPHCVAFYESFVEGLVSYVVMEKCDLTLLRALERGPELTEHTLARIFREMLWALSGIHACTHGLAVVHRDIKPDNWLCSGADQAIKLCDFGLAEVLPRGGGELRGVFGTPPFMSPEMVAGSGYGTATDVWSLGVIAYVLLFGEFPYKPLERTSTAMKAAILAGTPTPTFAPKASLSAGELQHTPAALAFVHALLRRDKTARPTAAAALQLEWVSPGVSGQQQGAPSLRPTLHAAKRAGAFDLPGRKDQRPSGMDIALASLQAQHHGPVAGPAHPDAAVGNEAGMFSLVGTADKTQPESVLETAVGELLLGASPSAAPVSNAADSWASPQSRLRRPARATEQRGKVRSPLR